MAPWPGRLLRATAYAVLALTAALGLALAGLWLVAATDAGTAAAGRLVVGVLDGALQGRFTVEGLSVRPDGLVELRGFRAATPEGRTALRVARLVVRLDLVAVAKGELNAQLQLEEPEVTLEPGADGRLTLARVFTPPPDRSGAPRRSGDPLAGWSFHFPSVVVHGGAVTWRDTGGAILARAERLELAGSGGFGWARADGRLRLAGMMETPLAGPLAVTLDALLRDGRLSVQRLEVSARRSRLEAVGWWRLEDDAFRVAATRLELARADGAGLLPRAAPGASLSGVLYAESDGKRLTAAADLAPAGGGEGGGRAALALRLGGRGPTALAFDTRLTALDPSRLLARAPPARISLTARGGAVGPPRGWLGAGGARLEVDRLEARLDGLTAVGSLRWRPAGEVAGTLALDAPDLAAARRALAALLPWELPALSGVITGEATLSGTAAMPVVTLHAEAPRLTIDEVELEALRLDAGHDAAADGLTLRGTMPRLGPEPFSVEARVRRGRADASAQLTDLSLAWPGHHWSLAGPAQLVRAPLAVDRLELRDGTQRLTIEGGWRSGGRVEARARASGFDLSGVPRRLLPAELGLAGTASFDLQLSGDEAHPSLAASLEVVGGRAWGLEGLELRGSAGWDGPRRVASADLRLASAGGGVVTLSGAVPLPLASAPGDAAVAAHLEADRLAVERLWPLRGAGPAPHGEAALRVELRGTVEAPLLGLQARVTGLGAGDVPPCDVEVALDVDAEGTRARATLRREQAVLASAAATLRLDRAALLRHPAGALAAAGAAPWQATAELPGAPVGWLAGHAGLPASLTGVLAGHAALTGTPRAPRGSARLSLKQGGVAGHRDLSIEAEASLEADRVALTGVLQPERGGRLDWRGALGLPVERLGAPEAAASAPLQLDVTARDLDLAERLDPRREVTGRMSATLTATGTLAAPSATLTFEGSGIAAGQVLIGELQGAGRLEPGRASLQVDLATAFGGSLHAEGALETAIGLHASLDQLLRAPLSGKARAVQLDLGSLPAFLPRLVPAARGRLDAEVDVTGTLASPRFAGRARTEGARLTVAEYGTYTDVGFDASLDPASIRVERLVLRRGAGTVEGRFSLTRGAGDEATIDGEAKLKEFTVGRSGVDYVTIDSRPKVAGKLTPSRLDLEVTAPDGVRLLLPRKSPRSLQATEGRPDITIGEPPPAPPQPEPEAAPGAGRPFEAHVHVRTDSLVVRSDQPRVHVEVRTDSTWSVVGGALLADGTIDLVHGTVEPMSGRVFKVSRTHVGFNGGPVGEAQLDVTADYDNPTAKVHVSVVGTLAKPQLRLTSTPPLDEASIAMLIATGRTAQTVGGSASTPSTGTASSTSPGTFTAQDAGMAAAMAVANKAFQEQLGDKMPLDTLTLDSTSMSAGKYVTDRILVSYLRRFDARPDKGENTDEVRVQYQMSRRWTLETRYGNAGAGGASVLWQADY